MSKTYVALLLHAYQPPTQPSAVIDRIYRESYDPVIALLERQEGSLSLDLAKSLGERLPREFLQRVASLRWAGKIEMVNTAAYHYLLPLVPPNVVARQLVLNNAFTEDALGAGVLCGVWPPELALNERVLGDICAAGHAWALADEISVTYTRRHLPEPEQVPNTWIPRVQGCGVLPRSRRWSGKIAWGEYTRGDHFLADLLAGQQRWREALEHAGPSYVILALDYETFGHHLPGSVEQFLGPLFREAHERSDECAMVGLDDLFHAFPKADIVTGFTAASWSTSEEDLAGQIPFPLWDNPHNAFHVLWNQFVRTALDAAGSEPAKELQRVLDQAFYSCTPWQYSRDSKEVARWALPLFAEITCRLSHADEAQELETILARMTELTRI